MKRQHQKLNWRYLKFVFLINSWYDLYEWCAWLRFVWLNWFLCFYHKCSSGTSYHNHQRRTHKLQFCITEFFFQFDKIIDSIVHNFQKFILPPSKIFVTRTCVALVVHNLVRYGTPKWTWGILILLKIPLERSYHYEHISSKNRARSSAVKCWKSNFLTSHVYVTYNDCCIWL